MSENYYASQYDELKAVELKIETIKARNLELQKKAKIAEGLTTDEQVELEDLQETIQELKKDKKFWQDLITTKEDNIPIG